MLLKIVNFGLGNSACVEKNGAQLIPDSHFEGGLLCV